MAESIKGSGAKIKWTAEECLHGPMEEDMKGNIKRIRNKALEHSSGLMVEGMWENGTMVSNMGKVLSLLKMVNKEKESG